MYTFDQKVSCYHLLAAATPTVHLNHMVPLLPALQHLQHASYSSRASLLIAVHHLLLHSLRLQAA